MNTYIGQWVRCNRTSDPQRQQNSIENENYIEMNVLPSISPENIEQSFNETSNEIEVEVDLNPSTVAILEVNTTTDIDQPVDINCSSNTIGQSVQYRDGQINFISPSETDCLSTKDSAMLNFDNIEYDRILPH